jgi:hypothetical protein
MTSVFLGRVVPNECGVCQGSGRRSVPTPIAGAPTTYDVEEVAAALSVLQTGFPELDEGDPERLHRATAIGVAAVLLEWSRERTEVGGTPPGALIQGIVAARGVVILDPATGIWHQPPGEDAVRLVRFPTVTL